MSEYKLCCELRCHDDCARCVCSQFPYVISGGLDGHLVVHEITKQNDVKFLSKFSEHKTAVYSVSAFTSPGTSDVKLLSGDRQGKLLMSSPAGHGLRIFFGANATISSVATNPSKSLVAGGTWDGKLLCWSNEGTLMWTYHENLAYAVAVCAAGDTLPNAFVCGSQTKALMLVDSGRLLASYPDAHADIIRSVQPIRNLPDHFVTSSNDGAVAVWKIRRSPYAIKSIPIGEFGSWHPTMSNSFVFDVSAVKTENGFIRIAACCDDGTLAMAELQLEDEIASIVKMDVVWQCGGSVWSVDFMDDPKTGCASDIVIGCEDNTVRLFSAVSARQQPEEAIAAIRQDALEQAQAKRAAAGAPSGVDKSKIPSVKDKHTRRGKQAGSTSLFLSEDGQNIEVHQWTGQEWIKIGDMLDQSQEGKQFYAGDDFFPAGYYDHVFNVEIDNRSGQLKLPFNNNANTVEAAERFCAREHIGSQNISDIMKFLQTNTAGQAKNGMQSKDASQAKEQVTSTTAASSPTLLESQPRSGTLPNALDGVPAATFKGGRKWQAAATKIVELNEKQEESLRLELHEITALYNTVEVFESANGEFRSSVNTFLFKYDKWAQWQPAEDLFPFFDFWRQAAMHTQTADFFRRNQGMKHILFALELAGKVDQGPMRLCVFRLLANLSQWTSLRPLFASHVPFFVDNLQWALAATWTGLPVKHALCGFLLNLAQALRTNSLSFATTQAQKDDLVKSVNQLLPFTVNLVSMMDTAELWSGYGTNCCGLLALSLQAAEGKADEACKFAAKKVTARPQPDTPTEREAVRILNALHSN